MARVLMKSSTLTGEINQSYLSIQFPPTGNFWAPPRIGGSVPAAGPAPEDVGGEAGPIMEGWCAGQAGSPGCAHYLAVDAFPRRSVLVVHKWKEE